MSLDLLGADLPARPRRAPPLSWSAGDRLGADSQPAHRWAPPPSSWSTGDRLGADSQPAHPRWAPPPLSWSASAIAIAAGVAGALLWRKHRVLGFLGLSALASNAHAVAAGDRTWKVGAERVGRHVVATAGSLALPSHPAIGYVAAAVAAELLLDDKEGGLLVEWAHYAGVKERGAVPKDAIDVTPVKALAEHRK
jgi:hypothetical protein